MPVADLSSGMFQLKDPLEILPNLDKSFEMNFRYKRKPETTIIKIKDKYGDWQRILTNGNFALIISKAGSGKSNIIEALAANALVPECDAFGFKVDIGEGSVAILDTERAYNDFHDGLHRIVNRASIAHDNQYLTEDRIKKCHLFSYKQIDDVDLFLKNLWHHVNQGYKLILVDQIADFLMDVNQMKESKILVRELEKMCAKTDCGMVLTIHPNPLDPNMKATGNLGSFLQKKCESALACIKADDQTRTITSNFGHGKLRNAKPIETAFMWDDDKKMFIGAQLTSDIEEKVNRKNMEMDSFVEELFQNQRSATKEELWDFIKEKKNDMKLKWEFIQDYIDKRAVVKQDLFGNYFHNIEEKMDAPF